VSLLPPAICHLSSKTHIFTHIQMPDLRNRL
jgi:hypothetical protein